MATRKTGGLSASAGFGPKNHAIAVVLSDAVIDDVGVHGVSAHTRPAGTLAAPTPGSWPEAVSGMRRYAAIADDTRLL